MHDNPEIVGHAFLKAMTLINIQTEFRVGLGLVPLNRDVFEDCYFILAETRDCSTPVLCCCLPTPMTLANGASPIFPLVVHQPASPSIWPAVQSLRRGLSTNPGATMWCVCGYS